MAQVFSRAADRRLRIGLAAVLAVALLAAARLAGLIPPDADAAPPPDQPRPFSHAHHAGAIGIGCAYCHTSAATAAKAGFPPVETCAGCHLSGALPGAPPPPPLPWRRVAVVADHVFFHHGIHVSQGIGCAACHGDTASQEKTHQPWPFTMAFCLDCHRAAADAADIVPTALTNCHVCHR